MILNDNQQKQYQAIKTKDTYTVADWEFVFDKVTSGGYYISKGLLRPYLAELLVGMLTSQDYTIKDVIFIGSNGYQDNVALMMELVDIDLTDTLKKIQVPYHIVQREDDVITSPKPLREIVQKVDNDDIRLEIIPSNKYFQSLAMIQKLVAEFEWVREKGDVVSFGIFTKYNPIKPLTSTPLNVSGFCFSIYQK